VETVDLRRWDLRGHLAAGRHDLRCGRDVVDGGVDRLGDERLADRRHQHRQQEHTGQQPAPRLRAQPQQVGHDRGQVTEQADHRRTPPPRRAREQGDRAGGGGDHQVPRQAQQQAHPPVAQGGQQRQAERRQRDEREQPPCNQAIEQDHPNRRSPPLSLHAGHAAIHLRPAQQTAHMATAHCLQPGR
jgi:hypothetical protein